MISSTSNKFIKLILLAVLLCSSCHLWQDNSNKSQVNNNDREFQTNIPFSNKEPESFQTEIIVTSFLNCEKTERKYFLAKDNKKSLQTFNTGSDLEQTILRNEEGRTFIINRKSESYREISKSENSAKVSESSLINDLTARWLNEKNSARFEKLGVEKDLTKYRVILNEGKNSEIFIFVDEKLGLPVRQEFYSVEGDKKILTSSIEFKNFSKKIEDKLFELPKEYKEVSQ